MWGKDGLLASGYGGYMQVALQMKDWPLEKLSGLFIEEAFIGVNKRSGMKVATIGGFFEGVVCATAGREVPTMKLGSKSWRKRFGWGHMKRGEAKEAAIAWAKVHKDSPTEDEAEAICMAHMAYEEFIEAML